MKLNILRLLLAMMLSLLLSCNLMDPEDVSETNPETPQSTNPISETLSTPQTNVTSTAWADSMHTLLHSRKSDRESAAAFWTRNKDSLFYNQVYNMEVNPWALCDFDHLNAIQILETERYEENRSSSYNYDKVIKTGYANTQYEFSIVANTTGIQVQGTCPMDDGTMIYLESSLFFDSLSVLSEAALNSAFVRGTVTLYEEGSIAQIEGRWFAPFADAYEWNLLQQPAQLSSTRDVAGILKETLNYTPFTTSESTRELFLAKFETEFPEVDFWELEEYLKNIAPLKLCNLTDTKEVLYQKTIWDWYDGWASTPMQSVYYPHLYFLNEDQDTLAHFNLYETKDYECQVNKDISLVRRDHETKEARKPGQVDFYYQGALIQTHYTYNDNRFLYDY